jgi:hypothetical protein
MDDVGTLFCLLLAVAADLYQCFDHPFKRIHFVIPHYKTAGFFMTGEYISHFFFVGKNIVFSRSHRVILYAKI